MKKRGAVTSLYAKWSATISCSALLTWTAVFEPQQACATQHQSFMTLAAPFEYQQDADAQEENPAQDQPAPANAENDNQNQPGEAQDNQAGEEETDGITSREQLGAQNAPLENEMTPRMHEAVASGLRYLASQQNSDGSFGRGRYGRNVAITALSGLAFMSDGNLPGRGEYGEQVQKALDFIVEHSAETGLLAADTSHGPMYGHGFAALFLGEIYGMNPEDERVRDALVKAVDLIVGTQNEEGGWRYNPIPYDADISVTICQVMALRSARNAGIKVPKVTIDRAIQYVKNCQNPDGGFKYMLQSGGSAWPRTAAGVASLFYAGIYNDDSIDRGIAYLKENSFPGKGMSQQAHYFYGHYYAVQAMYLSGGKNWSEWWPAIRDELLLKQTSNGSWIDNHAGGAYATAMGLIILQMPKRYLPIFQK